MGVIIERLDGRRLRVASDTCETVVDGSGGSTEAFRSVDLLLGALGSCTVGTMLTAAESEGIALSGVRVELRPMVTFAPERVSKIRMTMSLDGDLTQEEVAFLRTAAESCKVHQSLHAGVETSLDILVKDGS